MVSEDQKAEVLRLLVENLPRLRKAAYVLAEGTRADFEDVVQRTCEAVIKKWQSWRGIRFRPWVWKILRSELRKEREREALRQGVDLGDIDVAEFEDQDAFTDMAAVLQRLDLEGILSKLAFEHREVLYMIVIEECTYDEVAEILEVPYSTVISRYRRARIAALKLAGA